MATEPQPKIPESFFEHRIIFGEPWVDKWILPNPFITPLVTGLRASGVELTDYVFNKDASTLGETHLNVSVRRLSAVARISLESVTLMAANPDWASVQELVSVFERIIGVVCAVTGTAPISQKAVLAFHVTSGAIDFKKETAALVNAGLLGEAEFFGVSLHRRTQTTIIDKSLKYESAAFVRLERTFSGDVLLSEVASELYQDEVSALNLLGISEIP